MAGLPFACCPILFHSHHYSHMAVGPFSRRFRPPVQRALMWKCWGAEVSFWTVHQSECAVRREVVQANVFVLDMNAVLPDHVDELRIEAIADGFPFFHGAQFAIDTTHVFF